MQHLQAEYSGAHQGLGSSDPGTPGPPPYEIIAQNHQGGPSELPPPTYAEAVALLQQAGICGEHRFAMRKRLGGIKNAFCLLIFTDGKFCGSIDQTDSALADKP